MFASWAPVAALGHPRPEDLLAHVDDLDRARLVRQVRERRLHRDQPVEQVRLVVLEADVQDVGLAARGDVARHLEGHRGLAGALGATDQQQLTGAQPAADGLVQRREPERDRLVLADLAADDLLVEVDEDVERRARRHAAVRGVESPGRRRGGLRLRVGGFGAHVRADLPEWCGDAKGSIRIAPESPTRTPRNRTGGANGTPCTTATARGRRLSAGSAASSSQVRTIARIAGLVVAQVHPLVGRVGVVVGLA